MRSVKGKAGSIWIRQQPRSDISLDDINQFVELKKQAKKIGILTRMEKRTKTNQSAFTCVRPNSTSSKQYTKANRSENRGTISMKEVQNMYLRDKSQSRQILESSKKGVYREQKGLLGQMQRYEEMSKRQLIQKLISLQHLANTIFKRNKFLQQQLKKKSQP